MGRQLRIEYPNAYYHVTSRGNERKEIYSRATGTARSSEAQMEGDKEIRGIVGNLRQELNL